MSRRSSNGAPKNADEVLALLESTLDASDEGILVTDAQIQIANVISFMSASSMG
jgi:hypothetical protein